ncbi:hypothetical protein GCM10010909_01590 [Acidocella aquatica]|uniref:EthD domain-containing protein n=1 Tax=Acidocella aquatica TaxID=1922313 RepID=A0ABQ5ZZ32_9PROT|nr:hypothetical protein [Acidocella aquatica]GLR65481.1 hypothetical protein GCM10010909_01590 [Acidocella aquatica]
MKQLLIVLSNPRGGRDDEFNEWYSYVHLWDVLRGSPGAIAAQRFALAPGQLPGAAPLEHRYLAVYEADEHQGFTDGHAEVFTPAMPISDAFSFEDFREAYYEPFAARKRAAGPKVYGDVIIERIAASAGAEDFANWYADHRLPQITRLPGFESGRISRAAAHQMLPPNPDSHYIALYRVSDHNAALAALAALNQQAPPPWPASAAITACYTPLIPRLTAYAALHPSPELAARAAKARAALGSRVYTGFPSLPGLPPA